MVENFKTLRIFFLQLADFSRTFNYLNNLMLINDQKTKYTKDKIVQKDTIYLDNIRMIKLDFLTIFLLSFIVLNNTTLFTIFLLSFIVL